MTRSQVDSDPKVPSLCYRTGLGRMLCGDSNQIVRSRYWREIRGKTKLILTSPPFPLASGKSYGNLRGKSYVDWLTSFAPVFREMLKPDGSIVIEMGNGFVPGAPVLSTAPYEALLSLKEAGGFHLCQEFIWFNPSRLPSPVKWVNVERIRVKDSFTRLWWLSRSEWPDADNRRVLVPYSDAMKRLLQTKRYNGGNRPSEHNIGATSFLSDNGGAIPPNVLVMANTSSNDGYSVRSRLHGLQEHPARMPVGIARFFINFLTRQGDLILDPFAGSNTTGFAAETLKRRWIGVEVQQGFALASKARFSDQ